LLRTAASELPHRRRPRHERRHCRRPDRLQLAGQQGSIKTTGALAGFNGNGVAVASIGSGPDVRLGWTVGAGIEGKITNNWSAKLECLYMDFDSFHMDFDSFRAGSFTLVPLATVGANVDTRFHDHVLRVGLNYTIGGPVIAKY
jgi:outer membrane immunogenic protein